MVIVTYRGQSIVRFRTGRTAAEDYVKRQKPHLRHHMRIIVQHNGGRTDRAPRRRTGP